MVHDAFRGSIRLDTFALRKAPQWISVMQHCGKSVGDRVDIESVTITNKIHLSNEAFANIVGQQNGD